MRALRLLSCLLLVLVAAPAQQGDRFPDAATLEREFAAAQDRWNQALRAASAKQDQAELARLRGLRPQGEFAPKFREGATLHAGAEAAVPYLAWLVSRGPTEVATESMTTLMEHHVASPGIRLAVARIGGLKQQFGVERSRGWLDRVLEHNADPQVLAQARYTRAAMYVGTRAVATSDELRAQAIADLEAALALLTDGADGTSLRGLATRLLDEARRLEPGLAAPEIEGQDLDGVPFKLSDYRGKVVLLDFWGDW